jgi:hypothetical protein
MKIQLLSDLHLETETFEPEPAPGAELLVLAGDIDAGWGGYRRFAGWPVPVIAIAGNHEFDYRELDSAWPALRDECARSGIRLLECETLVIEAGDGRRVRFAGTVRWSDFDLFGEALRPRVERAAAYFMRLMAATKGGQPFDAAAMRAEAIACRQWLETTLAEPARGRWDATVVITHFGPSLRSADPRFGRQPSTASFCNADDDLIGRADLWLHGRHDYRVARAGRRPARVVSQARGLATKGEAEGFDPVAVIQLD